MHVRGGLLAGARLFMAVEGHAGAKQNLHFRSAFAPSRLLWTLAVPATVAGLSAVLAGSWLAAGLVAAFAGGVAYRANSEWRSAAGAIQVAVAALNSRAPFFDDRDKSAATLDADDLDQTSAVYAAE